MKRDFSVVLKALGSDVPNADGNPMTLKEACVAALMANYADDQNTSGETKFERYQLAQRISNACQYTQGIAEVTSEEISTLKALIGKAFTPIVVGPAYELLETDVPKEENAAPAPRSIDPPDTTV